MSLRVPVVATAAGAIPEVVGDAALLVAPRDVPALAEALLAVATDATVRQRLVAAGTERVPLFTWQRAGRRLAALYRSLADVHA
jgi:glycosyltransferase involved in cell wall biosynthesis